MYSYIIMNNGVRRMKVDNEKYFTHPVIRKCMQHLDIIHANDRTKQIVYMYLKTMDEEINNLKDNNHHRQT